MSLATVATCAVLAGAVFGGAYALAHADPAEPAPAPASPTTIRLEDDSIGELHRVSPLPALIVPPPNPKPAQPAPVVSAPAPQISIAAPAPARGPAPAPRLRRPAPAKAKAKAKAPLTFDNTG